MNVMEHEKWLKEIKKVDAVLVCMPSHKKTFDDDILDHCDKCKGKIHYRPYNKKATRKICIICANEQLEKEAFHDKKDFEVA